MGTRLLQIFDGTWPYLVFFLSLAAAIFACKAHGQAVDNGELIRELRRQMDTLAAGLPGQPGAVAAEVENGQGK